MPVEIILHDETQLVDWGESRAGGPWIKLRLSDPALLERFRGMDTASMKKTGHILNCTLAEGDIVELAEDLPEKPQHGKFWRALIASGFFRADPVLRAIGPEVAFEAWIRKQPSVLDSAMDWDTRTGEGRCEVAHVRRVAEGSGTSERPPYFAVPLTSEQHRMQHQSGEGAALLRWGSHPEADAKQWFEAKADHFRNEWASKRLAQALSPGCSSRSEVAGDAVLAWCKENDLMRYMPRSLRD